MRVTTVSASVRYSKALGDGAHKTIELSAEATLDAQDTWQEAQANLYAELGQQLKALWSLRNGGEAPNGNGNTQDTPKAEHSPSPAKEGHFCQEHKAEFKRFEKEGRVWYAHKAGQAWCREKS